MVDNFHALINLICQFGIIMEGQLDECELTLRDLTMIREAFLKILIGIHHQRIKYPEEKVESENIAAPKGEETVQGQETEIPQKPAESEAPGAEPLPPVNEPGEGSQPGTETPGSSNNNQPSGK